MKFISNNTVNGFFNLIFKNKFNISSMSKIKYKKEIIYCCIMSNIDRMKLKVWIIILWCKIKCNWKKKATIVQMKLT